MTDTLALVLGAGGLTGNAWEVGVLHGLAEAGTDLSVADVVIGSSAGAIVGAQLTSGKVSTAELYERQFAPYQGPAARRLGVGTLLRYATAVLSSRTPEAYGQKLGRLALGARTGVDEAARRDMIAALLPSHVWPDSALRVTAVGPPSPGPPGPAAGPPEPRPRSPATDRPSADRPEPPPAARARSPRPVRARPRGSAQ